MKSSCRRVGVARALVMLVALGLPAVVTPVSPGTDLVVPAVARVGSWVTDLYLFNTGDETAEVEIHWLERGRPNPDPPGVALTLAPNETRILGDVVYGSFGLEVGEGALWITGDAPIVADCRVFARAGDATYGQAAAAVPVSWATSGGTARHVVGLASNADFRSNVYALAGPEGAVVRLALLDLSGSEFASTVLRMGIREPFLRRVDRLFKIDPIGEATLLLEVQSGSAVIGASRIDNVSSDPITLTSWIDHDALAAGLVFGAVHGAASTGGIALAITPAIEVEGLEFTFPADRCEAVFSAGQDLAENPLPLADLAIGHSFTSDYPAGGAMSWRLQLDQDTTGPTLSGTIAATGSGWTGDLAECNGEHGSLDVDVGRQRP